MAAPNFRGIDKMRKAKSRTRQWALGINIDFPEHLLTKYSTCSNCGYDFEVQKKNKNYLCLECFLEELKKDKIIKRHGK